MPRQGREHAVGPYKHGRKFRIVYFAANGASETVSYETEAEAVAERDAYNAAAGSRTVSEAVQEYIAAYPGRGVDTARYRLTAILRLREGDRPLDTLTAPLARELYTKRSKEVKPDTHQGELSYVSRFCKWCVDQGWLRVNPFADVKPVGVKHTREDEQLRVNEARRFRQTAMEEDSLESIVVLMALMMGLRAHEVVERTVRDIDADGTILWVPKSKTKAGKRQLAIPEELQPALLARCEGKGPDELIFTRGGARTNPTRHWLHYHVVRIAKAAGVPRVTPHGLRRTWMTMGVLGEQMGARRKTLAEVAAEGGHADRGVTARRHYIAPGAIDSATSTRVVEILGATKTVCQPLAHSGKPTHVSGVSKPYETRSVVMEDENTITNDLGPEVN